MTVSKRLRYEILRRDNHTCRYCGASAPEVKLTVDHVVPVALGGTDEPENLVTACVSCNAGKTSVSPDSPLVADVKQDALRWSIAMEQATELQRARRREVEEFCDRFEDAWNDVFFGDYWIDMGHDWRLKDDPDRMYEVAVCSRNAPDKAYQLFDDYEDAVRWIKSRVFFPELPADWRSSVETWHTAGIRIPDVRPLMESTASKRQVGDKWRYFCGCVWSVVRERSDIAQSLLMKEQEDTT